jgi:hypothetical protein
MEQLRRAGLGFSAALILEMMALLGHDPVSGGTSL